MLVAAATALLLTGCGRQAAVTAQDGGGAPLTAAAAVFPLAWLAGEVAPDARVELLSEGSLEAHDIELSPGQRAAVQTADVVLYLGDIDYQPQVEAAAQAAEGQVVDVTEVAGEQRLLLAGADPHPHADEGDDHADGEQLDPHLWFDAAVMADVALRTGEAFAAADPARADVYRANARAVADDLRALESELDRLLGGDCRLDEAIVSHIAYTYLVQPHGKELNGIGGVDPEAGASGAQLAELVREVHEEGITHVLAEPVEGRQDAEALAREAGVELLEVHPLDAVTPEQADASFVDLVREQAETFATAYDCP